MRAIRSACITNAMKVQLAIVFAIVAITHSAPPNPCDPNPCVRGTCSRSSDTLGFSCICEQGFSGDTCQYGPCDSSPCGEGLCLTSSVRNSYTCLCPSHRGGTNCELALGGCDSHPCRNGATCMLSSSDSTQYICICAPGYSGSTCDDQQDGCDSNPCLNGGTCLSSSSNTMRYLCVCASGYSGSVCENEVNPCLSNPCHNGGICQQEVGGGFSCRCDSQFGGTQCLLQMTCELNPCKNGGSCYLNYNDGITYMCKCPDNFKGKDCSKPDPCSSNPCASNSVCLTEDDGSYSCLCRCGTGGSCSNTNNGEDGGTRPSVDAIQCNNLMRIRGNCSGRGECAFDTNRQPYCRCDASYYGISCQYTVASSTPPGSDGSDEFSSLFMCPESTDVIGCRFVFSEMDKCNNRGCCSSDLRGGAKCSCRDGYGGNKCQYDCAISQNGCSSSDQNAGTGGTSNGGSGTEGAGTGGVRSQVVRDPFICQDVLSPFPTVECGRVRTETGACSNQGCCSIDTDGDARCRCNDGFGGPRCEYNCDLNPADCGTSNGAGGSSSGGAGSGGSGTGGAGTDSGSGVRTQVERDPFMCLDVSSPFPIVECGRVRAETGTCSNQGCCSIDTDGDARCRCNDGFGGPRCEYNCDLNPADCGTANGAGGSSSGGSGTGGSGTGGAGTNGGSGVRPQVERDPFMCLDVSSPFPIVECGRVRAETGTCSNQGCCSIDTDGDARCRCNDGFGGPRCEYNCDLNPADCGTANGAGGSSSGGARTGGTGTGGSGTGGTGTDGGSGVRPQVERDPFMCLDVSSPFPIVECGRVRAETGTCSNQGCCSIDTDGDARCRCNDGFGGPRCEYNCDLNPADCGTANGAGGSSSGGAGTGGAGTGGAGTGGTGTDGGSGVRPQVERDPFMCVDVSSPFPIVECGRVRAETGTCSNQGCCSIDADGDARCRCNDGYGGPNCEFNCAVYPDGCGSASGSQ